MLFLSITTTPSIPSTLSLHSSCSCSKQLIILFVFNSPKFLNHFGQFHIIWGLAYLIPFSKVQATFLCISMPLSSIFCPSVFKIREIHGKSHGILLVPIH